MAKFYYLIILVSTLIFPLILSFHKKNLFYKQWRSISCSLTSVLIVFIPWDVMFTINKIWGFNKDYVLGIYLLFLPVEEWLFFIIVNFSVLFIFHLFQLNFKENKMLNLFSNAFYISIGLIFCYVIFYSIPNRWYTFIATFMALILLVIILLLGLNVFRQLFFITFIISIIPFLIVNGALTGLFSSSPIVSYDDSKNMGLRLLTIPVDDIIYNFDMILFSTLIYYISKVKKFSY